MFWGFFWLGFENKNPGIWDQNCLILVVVFARI